MDLNKVEQGLRVKVISAFRDNATDGMFIAEKNLAARRPDAEGVILGWVPGHGGDVWWVQHEDAGGDGVVAAYCFDEFNPL